MRKSISNNSLSADQINKRMQECLGIETPVDISKMTLQESYSLIAKHKDNVIEYLNTKARH